MSAIADVRAVSPAPSPPPALEANGLACGHAGRAVLSEVSLRLEAGRVLSILGPNGVGKTTLFKTLLGFLPALAGEVRVGGEVTSEWSRKRFAQAVAYIPQLHTPSFSYSVFDVVLMGRTPHLSGMSSPSRSDEAFAQEVIEQLQIAHLAQRDYSTLSGGERQMVLIARAIAQQPRVMIMDEPCASLDFGNQAILLGRIAGLADQGMAVVMTTHDPNHAFALDGDVLCLAEGSVLAQGRARDVLDADALGGLYGVDMAVGDLRSSAGACVRACAPVGQSIAPGATGWDKR